MEQKALEVFWRMLILENNKEMMGPEEAMEFAKETIVMPIDTHTCMQYDHDSGWWLLTASGTKIVDVIEGGDIAPAPKQ